ncbi:hypothetical protein FGO68_gene12041 [Halteria grandinella]|uniref:CS domain-containing protein n=1 Tax=Halteria grandinella TaxID=5974 RepID=A0A8J8P047_HALGN|nr:hypothetical protein FGO68_gene12041 [Halteria grandinella]
MDLTNSLKSTMVSQSSPPLYSKTLQILSPKGFFSISGIVSKSLAVTQPLLNVSNAMNRLYILLISVGVKVVSVTSSCTSWGESACLLPMPIIIQIIKMKQTLFTLLSLLTLSSCAFYDCPKHLSPLRSDLEGLELVKQAHTEKLKFSSECLEILLKKNFFLSSEYLLNEYYPKTSIDTEVIVRNVAADLKRSQDHLVFQIKKREKQGVFPIAKPVVYWAQSTEDLLIMIRLHELLDTPDCRESFERETVIEDDRIRVQAYCYTSEDDIKLFDTEELELKRPIDAGRSTFEWRGDGRVVITLKKQDGPSFWKYMLKDSVREAKELQTWWEQRDKHIEQLEDYIMEENVKERAAKKANDDL